MAAMRIASSDGGHADRIQRLIAAHGPGYPVFIQQGALGVKQVEVAARHRHVHGLETAAAFLVQDVEALHQADEVAHFGVTAVAATLVAIHHVSRATDRRKHGVAVSKADVLVGISGLQGETRRCFSQQRFHQFAVEAQQLRIRFGIESDADVILACLRRQNQHAGLLQDGKTRLVNAFDGVAAEQFEGRVSIAQRFPG
jgi:hypothetical protein